MWFQKSISVISRKDGRKIGIQKDRNEWIEGEGKEWYEGKCGIIRGTDSSKKNEERDEFGQRGQERESER